MIIWQHAFAFGPCAPLGLAPLCSDYKDWLLSCRAVAGTPPRLDGWHWATSFSIFNQNYSFQTVHGATLFGQGTESKYRVLLYK